MIDQIHWFSISSLRQIHTVLSMKIDQLTPDIPSDQEDDYFTQPRNIALSFRLRLLNSLLHKISKYIKEIGEDSQDPNAIDSEDILNYPSN